MTVHWVQLFLGGWILISPWLLGFSSISVMKWSNLIIGVAFILINVWIIFGGKAQPKE
jgi:hypothetical protein